MVSPCKYVKTTLTFSLSGDKNLCMRGENSLCGVRFVSSDGLSRLTARATRMDMEAPSRVYHIYETWKRGLTSAPLLK